MKTFFTITAFLLCSSLQAQWYSVNSNTSENLNDIFFVDSLVGYCVGGGDEYGLNNEGNGVVLKTTDGGESWTTIFSQDSLFIQYVAVVNENNYIKLYGFAFKNRTPYLVSTFVSSQFQNWTVEPISYHPVHVKTFQNKILFVDNIDSYLKVLQNNTITNIGGPTALYGIRQDNLVRMNITLDSIFTSSNFGNSWSALQSFPPEFGGGQGNNAKIISQADTIIIKSTYPGKIIYSSDRGNSWTVNGGGAPEFKSTIVSPHKIYGMDNLNRLLVTTDLGETWQIQDSLGVRINQLYFYNELMGFAVGEDGSIFKTTNGGGIASTKEFDNLKKRIKVFPNPASTNLRVEILDKLTVNSIRLFNQSSQLVKELAKEQRCLDLSDLPDGIYLLIFDTNYGSHIEKIIVEQ